MTSPAWYRHRSAVFALIYLLGFLGGWGVTGRPYGAAYASIGAQLGGAGTAAMLALACVFTLACLAVRAWGASYLTAAVVWNPGAVTGSLIVAGPFRYTRNPLYLGNVFLAFGFGLLAPLPGTVFIILANLAFVAALIRHEEAQMSRQYGEAFRAYCRAVPALFPRLLPAPGNAAVSAQPVQGMLSELFTACLAAGLFMWILVPRFGGYAFAILYVVGVLAQRAVERAQQAAVATPRK